MAPSAGTRRPHALSSPKAEEAPARAPIASSHRPGSASGVPAAAPGRLRLPAFGLCYWSWTSVLETACTRGAAEEGPCKGAFS